VNVEKSLSKEEFDLIEARTNCVELASRSSSPQRAVKAFEWMIPDIHHEWGLSSIFDSVSAPDDVNVTSFGVNNQEHVDTTIFVDRVYGEARK
jgi:hypothetical protein